MADLASLKEMQKQVEAAAQQTLRAGKSSSEAHVQMRWALLLQDQASLADARPDAWWPT